MFHRLSTLYKPFVYLVDAKSVSYMNIIVLRLHLIVKAHAMYRLYDFTLSTDCNCNERYLRPFLFNDNIQIHAWLSFFQNNEMLFYPLIHREIRVWGHHIASAS